MVNYVRNIIIVGVAASLAVTALPKNAANVGLYVKQLSAFLILAVILSPLAKMSDIIFAVKSGIESLDILSGDVAEPEGEADASEEIVCRYIVELLCSEYGFDRDETEVSLILDETGEEYTVREIQVFTSSGDSARFTAAEKYVSELFGAETHVFGTDVGR